MPAARKIAQRPPEREARLRGRRVALYGRFSGSAAGRKDPYSWVGKVLARHSLTIISGGRLGPTGGVIDTALKGKAKNIAVIVEPWEKGMSKNIPGKARNIVARSNQMRGTRPVHERLSLLQGSRVRAYIFLPIGSKPFSGTMSELQAIVNAYSLEHMTSHTERRPILLVGKEWKPIYEQIKESYASSWAKFGEHIRVIERPSQLEEFLK